MKFKNFLNEKNSIISKGNNLDPNFWNNFQSIINNVDELSDLLDVPRHKILSWHKKIKEAMENNKEKEKINYKKRVIKTGRII